MPQESSKAKEGRSRDNEVPETPSILGLVKKRIGSQKATYSFQKRKEEKHSREDESCETKGGKKKKKNRGGKETIGKGEEGLGHNQCSGAATSG